MIMSTRYQRKEVNNENENKHGRSYALVSQ